MIRLIRVFGFLLIGTGNLPIDGWIETTPCG